MDAGSINSAASLRDNDSLLLGRSRSAATHEHAQIHAPSESQSNNNPATPSSAVQAPAPPIARDESDSDRPGRSKSRIGFSDQSTRGQDSQNVQANSDGDSFKAGTTGALTDQEQKQVDKLEARDREVRTHEEAHRAAAGQLFRGGPNYSYKTGPDGRRYAVSGSVQIDTSPGRTPEETIEKAASMRRAALAPADPSGKDRAIAAKAARLEAQAMRELAETKSEELAQNNDQPTTDSKLALDGSSDKDNQGSFDLKADRFEPRSYASRSGGGQAQLASEEEPESLTDVFA